MMNICHILGITINAMAILLIVFMFYYKNEVLKYREWLYFGLNYGCHTPAEMKRLIDDLVKQINKFEKDGRCNAVRRTTLKGNQLRQGVELMICEYCKSENSNENKTIYDDEATERMSLDCHKGVWRIDCYGSLTGKINFCPMCGRPLNKTFTNELKADEKLCITYEKEWTDECRKNENKIIPYTAIPSEKVEELESLIRSAESIFESLVNVGILSFFIKLKDRYEVAYRPF